MRSAITIAETATRQPRAATGKANDGRPSLAPHWFLNPLAWVGLLALKTYQVCVPARYKPECRFTPTCSRYMALAIQKYGLLAGIKLGWNRFRHCVGFVPRREDWP